MKFWKSTKPLITAVVIFTLPASTLGQRTQRRGLDWDQLSRIGTRMQSLVDEGGIVGTVALVAMPGRELSVQAVGFQDRETRKPMRSDTIFDIRPVTKVVTAIGIMILLEEGKLALRKAVRKVHTRTRVRSAQHARQLLLHSG